MPGDRPSEDDLQRQLQEACAELERRVRAGGAGLAADLFAAYPALAANRDAALTLAYTEFVLRERLGQRPDTEVWCAGFPGLHDSLLQLLQVHRAVHTEMGTGADLTKTAPLSPGDSGALAEIGRRIGGYELLGVLGRGGMGGVYAARQAGLNRVVALKMIHGGAGAGPDAAARFRREAEVVAGLQHPNIVQVFEVGDQDGCPFLTMEYVAGGSLDQRLPGAPIPTRAAAALIEALARAADFAHQRGVVHRDLKPANVLLQPHPAAETLGTSPPTGVEAAEPAVDLARVTPKIVDFGLAKVLAGSAVPTLSGAVLGTPSYMAPEQARGDTKHVGPAADVYALGTILYECLTGRPPFRGETVPDTLRLVATQDPVPPTTLNPRTPRDLETVCLKCLEKDPARRYGTALALANDLGHFLRDEPVLARPPSVAYQVRKFAKRHKALLAGTAAVFAALVAGLIGTGIGLVRARAALDRAGRQRRAEEPRPPRRVICPGGPRGAAARGLAAGPDEPQQRPRRRSPRPYLVEPAKGAGVVRRSRRRRGDPGTRVSARAYGPGRARRSRSALASGHRPDSGRGRPRGDPRAPRPGLRS